MGNCAGVQGNVEINPAFSAPTSSGTGSKNSSKSATDTSTFGTKDSCSSSSVPPIPRTETEILQSSKLRKFTFSELKGSTRNFRPDSLLGEGGFGAVFKGWIDERTLAPVKPGTGMIVAVKKLKLDSFQGHREWLAEVNYLGQLSHPNLVKLIGYCLEDEQRLLMYEFMPRGSLEHHLFRRGSHFQPLPWNLRMKVALEAAKGLAFLHSDQAKVIYRDFKTSNVLIDSEYNAKLSDFGLAKDGPSGDKSHVSTRVMGTRGYAAPEYLVTDTINAAPAKDSRRTSTTHCCPCAFSSGGKNLSTTHCREKRIKSPAKNGSGQGKRPHARSRRAAFRSGRPAGRPAGRRRAAASASAAAPSAGWPAGGRADGAVDGGARGGSLSDGAAPSRRRKARAQDAGGWATTGGARIRRGASTGRPAAGRNRRSPATGGRAVRRRR